MMPLTDNPQCPVIARTATAARWQAVLLPLALGLLLLSYRNTVADLIETWTHSATFAHGMLIAPLSVGLIWHHRARWQALAVQPAPLMLIPLALAGMGWLLGVLGSVAVVQQFCLVGMLIALATLLQGMARARAQAFPLLYLLLAVPCGEFLIPPLIEITTAMTVGALRLSGVPVLRENNFLSLPSGDWSVMEACSGLRYLIATIAIASLYAYLNFSRWQRRLVFMLAAVLLPILANGMRAFGIVLLGHYSNMRWATGIDHLLYGWLFFAVLLAVLLCGGARWRERPLVTPTTPATPTTPTMPTAPATSRRQDQCRTVPRPVAHAVTMPLLIAALATIALWPLLAQQLLRTMASHSAVRLHLPEPAAPWQRASSQNGGSAVAGTGLSLWNADYRAHGTRVTLQLLQPFHAAARTQRGGDAAPTWQVLDTQQRHIVAGQRQLAVQQMLLRDGPRKLLVWRCYRLGGATFSRDWEIRLRQAASVLHGQAAVVSEIRLSAEYNDLDEAPDRAMQAFWQAMYGAILQELDHAAR